MVKTESPSIPEIHSAKVLIQQHYIDDISNLK